jgi:hypothetical protein
MEMTLPISAESFTTAFLRANKRDQILDKCMARIEKLTNENQELRQENIILHERLLAALEDQLRLTHTLQAADTWVREHLVTAAP